MDTTDLPADCRNEATAPEASPCVRHVTFIATNDGDAESHNRAESSVLDKGSPRGVHAVEFDAIDASHLEIFFVLDGGHYARFDARTGETIKSGVLSSNPTP